ncbi:lipase chaperone, partial [Flammeovirga sp. OC4]|uniref:lipase chaperone n=1 Tax=Flammeovirga sp. OC4 TaxID=1382345 RepID=UPI0005C66353
MRFTVLITCIILSLTCHAQSLDSLTKEFSNTELKKYENKVKSKVKLFEEKKDAILPDSVSTNILKRKFDTSLTEQNLNESFNDVNNLGNSSIGINPEEKVTNLLEDSVNSLLNKESFKTVNKAKDSVQYYKEVIDDWQTKIEEVKSLEEALNITKKYYAKKDIEQKIKKVKESMKYDEIKQSIHFLDSTDKKFKKDFQKLGFGSLEEAQEKFLIDSDMDLPLSIEQVELPGTLYSISLADMKNMNSDQDLILKEKAKLNKDGVKEYVVKKSGLTIPDYMSAGIDFNINSYYSYPTSSDCL